MMCLVCQSNIADVCSNCATYKLPANPEPAITASLVEATRLLQMCVSQNRVPSPFETITLFEKTANALRLFSLLEKR